MIRRFTGVLTMVGGAVVGAMTGRPVYAALMIGVGLLLFASGKSR